MTSFIYRFVDADDLEEVDETQQEPQEEGNKIEILDSDSLFGFQLYFNKNKIEILDFECLFYLFKFTLKIFRK